MPLQPPVAVQLVAFVEDQARVVDWPVLMVEGVAVRLTVGAVGGAAGVRVA